MTELPFSVSVFRNATGLIALTGDPKGSCLPPGDGPWRFEKVAKLGGDTPDEKHAIGLIDMFGFCCFDEHCDSDDEPDASVHID